MSRYRRLLIVAALSLIPLAAVLLLPRQSLPTSDAPPIVPLTVTDWIIAVVSPTTHLATALDSLETLMQNPRPDDPNWRGGITEQINTIQAAHFEVYRIAPPDEIKAVHVALLDAMRDCAAMALHLRRAIDNQDPNESQTARALLESCTSKMDGAGQMMDGLQRNN